MNIAGILIHAYPGHSDSVRAELEVIDGVELHHEAGDGRFIITVEDTNDTGAADTVLALQRMAGVASASLAYHSFEPENANTSATPGQRSACAYGHGCGLPHSEPHGRLPQSREVASDVRTWPCECVRSKWRLCRYAVFAYFVVNALRR